MKIVRGLIASIVLGLLSIGTGWAEAGVADAAQSEPRAAKHGETQATDTPRQISRNHNLAGARRGRAAVYPFRPRAIRGAP